MGFELASGVSFVRVGDRLVFVDTKQDRYFCLEDRADAAFQNLVGGREPGDVDRQSLAPLMADGTLIEKPDREIPRPCAPVAEPTSSALDDLSSSTSMARPIAMAMQMLRVRHIIRRRQVHSALVRLARRNASVDADAPASGMNIAEAVRALCAVQIFVSAENQCLLRSLALAMYLARQRVRVQLVLGVKLAPFGAHSWVQNGSCVLNDRPEQVRAFTPILVI